MNYQGLCVLKQGKPEDKIIVCFPYAGGNYKSYELFSSLYDKSANILVYEPPGHLYSMGEPVADIRQLCELYLDYLPQHFFEKEMILLGHSFGAYVACEFASQLLKKTSVNPKLVLCAISPPSVTIKQTKLSSLPMDELIEFLVDNDCLDEKFVNNKKLMDYCIKPLKADFIMYENFNFPKNINHLKALIVCGSEDKMCTAADVEIWKFYFVHSEICFIPGVHLFINNSKSLKHMNSLLY